MHFSLALADGMQVESSYGEEPVTFVVGDGTLDKGLELALIGLRPGDKQALTLMPGQAFGQRHDTAVQWIPRAQFPRDLQPEPGQIIGFSGENGEELPAAVLEVAADRVRVDFNHPLAGREIVFDVQILAVENPTDQQG
jgi:FKBP-type peptidyl-prolyl cis-trans isomerase SlpA